VTYYKLQNGLKVVLSEDHSAPLATVAVYYNIGFRGEPRDRAGFAHLFEHLMFQGSKNLGRMEFIRLVEGNGGYVSGSARFDFTHYYAVVPAHKTETLLWAEADRMRGLDFKPESLRNQQAFVANEIKVNVLNRPYGSFPFLDLPAAAFSNWHNSHNFYGDPPDIESANVANVRSFAQKFYQPQNAVLVVAGDFEETEARRWIGKYFEDIPSQRLEPLPDFTEPRQDREKLVTKNDKLAANPAVAFGYQMPPRGSEDYWAMGLLDQILVQGDDSLLHRELVQNRKFAREIDGGINAYFGNMFNYSGPTLFTVDMMHDESVSPAEILAASDGVIERLQARPVEQAMIDRAIVKLRSRLYDTMTHYGGAGRADLLACFALFDDKPENINRIEENLRRIRPAAIQRAAREYLRNTNRTVVVLKPDRPAASVGGAR
jgi:predicted Zn-dependent peptidase